MVHSLFFPFFSYWLFVQQAIESGQLVQGGVVTEGSAGSTAISIATVAPAYGCKCHVVIPDDAAIEKVCAHNIHCKVHFYLCSFHACWLVLYQRMP